MMMMIYILAVAKGFVSFGLSHDSFAFVFVGDFIAAAANQQVCIWKSKIPKVRKKERGVSSST